MCNIFCPRARRRDDIEQPSITEPSSLPNNVITLPLPVIVTVEPQVVVQPDGGTETYYFQPDVHKQHHV